MWGSWFGVTLGGLLVVLLFIGIAFGTSALLIPVIIAAVLMLGAGAAYVLKAGARGASEGPGTAPTPSMTRPQRRARDLRRLTKTQERFELKPRSYLMSKTARDVMTADASASAKMKPSPTRPGSWPSTDSVRCRSAATTTG